MKFSARTRYAARILLVLAKRGRQRPVSSHTLAVETGISRQFIDQILRQFRIVGVTASVRGTKGGHILAYQPDEVSFGCIVKLMEGGMELSECSPLHSKSCRNFPRCETRRVWRVAQIVLEDALESITLQDFLDQDPRDALALPELPA